MGDSYESCILVKNEVFVYRIPALQAGARGHRAADWNLEQFIWTGRLRVFTQGKKCTIRLEDKASGELFASCPVEENIHQAVEQVIDSSRYFVLRIQDDSGRHAFIGMGFADRGDSFDFNVSLQDHFRHYKLEEEASRAPALDNTPSADYSLKEGETITVKIKGKSGGSRPRPAAQQGMGSGGIILPPPPGPGVKVGGNMFGSSSNAARPQQQQQQTDEWGDFAGFGASDSDGKGNNSGWTTF
eukprot:Nk52_evm73s217 gene=Nk52_evmTU73s217